MKIAVFALAALVGLASGNAAAQSAAPAHPVVITEGEAIVRRAPDRAWISVATETREPKAADARRRGAEAMTEVQSAIRRAGISSDAIRTTAYSLTPEMEWNNGRGVVKGYLVRNQIEVRVDDLNKVGDVLEAANNSRNTSVSVSGPRFDLKDRAGAQREALSDAVAAAVARGQAMASGAKRSLGDIVRIEDRGNMGSSPEPYLKTMAMRADAVETPINPGEIEIRAIVSVTFELR